MIVALFGPPGVGKTTIGRAISKRNKNIVFKEEELLNNPYIKDSYSSSSMMLKSSLWFLDYFYNLEMNRIQNSIVIYDQGIEELIVYNNALLRCGYLKNEDYLIFKKEYESKIKDVPPIDLYIYYTVDLPLEKERIIKRNRGFEDIYITSNFLTVLREEYDKYLLTLPKNELMCIDGTFSDGIDRIVNRILKKR